jgi:2-C-methyl-D-erythritol 2,4-cyclodiphosphate synthase
MRVGFGYDAHRLVEGRRLVLGGVAVPFIKGLIGHSDADVLLHAVIDALIGAAGLGDIGVHFPPSSPVYKDASSMDLLLKTGGIVRRAGFLIVNIDSTIVCEAPRLSDHIPEMMRNISKALACEPGRVNVKAKTEEGLGFTGTGRGVKAYAVALIERSR